ncbi:MAG: hypothetical protein KF799_11115 [Bdellovibrionales bacterium]|nr:hypothetical protein [Bdellovibrionales bacterium]
MGRNLRLMGGTFLALLCIVSFQNCSSGFKANRDLALDSSSVQCRAKMKAEVTAAKLPAAELRCSDFNAFACERRVFSPDASNLSHALKECLPGDRICVDVDVLEFNTAGARAPANEDEFKPGGSYNREDIRCYHRLRIKGVVVFEGVGDSLAEALAGAVHACEAAQGEI